VTRQTPWQNPIYRAVVSISPAKRKLVWSGSIAEIGVGFDFDKPGAGGFLITGTPRMAPDKALNKIYKSKKYMKDVQQEMIEVFQKEIIARMGR
jgi:hypothetical protein